MDTEECQKALLTRIQKVIPYWDAKAIVHHIFDVLTLDRIRRYVVGPDADIHTLIDEMEKSVMSRDESPGPNYPPPSWNSKGQSSDAFEGFQAASAGQIGTSQLPGSSSVPDDGMREVPAPSWNSQAHQSSDTFEGIQAASVGQIGTSQLSGSSSVPDDGMRDFLTPSWNSQAQSNGTSVGIQSATAGQIVTLQIADDKSTGLKEHLQSSSVQGCSNVTRYLRSTSRSWPGTCYFYMSTRGRCKKGLSCEFSHGFGPSGKLEMEIRQLLVWNLYDAVSLEALSQMYFQCYNKHLPVGNIDDPHSQPALLRSLHTIYFDTDRYGRHFLALTERYLAYISYSVDLRDWDVDEEQTLIYIGFSAASRSICTAENVYNHFSRYGPVFSVTIPHLSTFGFVRFDYPGTVRLLLSEWNPLVPHFIFGEAVRVRPYIRNIAGRHGLQNGCNPGIVTEGSSGRSAPGIAPPLTHSQPSDPQMELVPLKGREATGSPDGDSADNSRPSHSQVEIDHPEGAEATGSPDRDSADNSQPSHSQLEIDHPEGGLIPDGLGINPVEGGEVPGGLERSSR